MPTRVEKTGATVPLYTPNSCGTLLKLIHSEVKWKSAHHPQIHPSAHINTKGNQPRPPSELSIVEMLHGEGKPHAGKHNTKIGSCSHFGYQLLSNSPFQVQVLSCLADLPLDTAQVSHVGTTTLVQSPNLIMTDHLSVSTWQFHRSFGAYMQEYHTK